MGLADRDYMRDRHRQGGATQRINSPSTGNHLKIGLVTVSVLALLTWGAVHFVDSRRTVPFPPTGEVRWFVPLPEPSATAPLTITAPADGHLNFAVKLSDWNTGKPIAIVPIRAGETASLRLPLGKYRIIIAKGKNWHGSETLFGRTGEVREAVAPMHFYSTEGGQSHGHRIDLAQRVNGNLETRPAGAF